MKNKNQRYKNYFVNLIFAAVIFGSITGIVTSLIVNFYKLCAKYVISISEWGYHYLSGHLYYIPLVIGLAFGVSFLLAWVYGRYPNLRGGGIPTSIGILRGVISFKWLSTLLGVFFLSLTSFLFGVPLGNEGPSVQIGTAVGRGSVYSFTKKHRAWDRYSMTGGACAGFSVATGAPISGIMFSIEEAHRKISPMIVIVSCISVLFAQLTTELVAPVFKVSTTLFPRLQLVELSLGDIWIPALIGIVMGLFAVLFLKYYKVIHAFSNKKLSKIPAVYKIFFVFVITIALGVCSFSFVSTGHELILKLFAGEGVVLILLLLLLARSTLTLLANSNRITGGIFLPILAIGTLVSALLGKIVVEYMGFAEEYYLTILVLGITACISGMMKMPITAIVFSIEALSGYGNIIYVVAVAAIAYMITEMFDVKSINDNVLERRVEAINEDKTRMVIDTFVVVKKGSFAIDKHITDILWPANLFVLSLQHAKTHDAEIDEHGASALHEGDVLHVRYSTFDEPQTKAELTAIVGEQDYSEKEADVI